MSEKRLSGRIALITGASRGIGRAVALAFADQGAQVICVARTQGGLEELDDEIRKLGGKDENKATLVTCDLTDFDAIDRMGAAVYERFGRLDVLVGNAGILGKLTPMHQLDPKIWDQVIGLDLTANWRLARSFDPLLRASDAGRAIFVSDGVADGVWPYWGAYAVAKAGLESMVRTYAGELQKTNVKVNIIRPGPVNSALRRQAFPGEEPDSIQNPEDITSWFIDLALPECTRNGEVIEISGEYASSS
ncbi:MAG TPA: SDR family NAD(P)-dependent oxidoreductase [Alphaproteobacteria bacterium]|nr:SDR family NAD(P)-dependent oxidoreductase [Alphaproteobacteria bacterium]